MVIHLMSRFEGIQNTIPDVTDTKGLIRAGLGNDGQGAGFGLHHRSRGFDFRFGIGNERRYIDPAGGKQQNDGEQQGE